MTALLFLPSTAGAVCGRRVDLAQLASRFAEVEAPARRARGDGRAARIALLLLVLAGAIGDTVLVSRHEALANCLAAARPGRASATATSS